jgi:hypothetical protein
VIRNNDGRDVAAAEICGALWVKATTALSSDSIATVFIPCDNQVYVAGRCPNRRSGHLIDKPANPDYSSAVEI